MNAPPRPWLLFDLGVARLAASGYRDAAWFYAGALPWCVTCLWVWNRFLNWHATITAYWVAGFVLSLLYSWKSFCTFRFFDVLFPGRSETPSFLRATQYMAASGLLFILWLISLVTLFWATAAISAAAAYLPFELRSARPLRRSLAAAFRVAFAQYGELQVFFLHALLITFAAVINVAVAIPLATRLFRYFGIHTLWTDTSLILIGESTTFWLGVLLLIYLLIAPIVQAALAVNYDRRQSLRTGEDLALALRRLHHLERAS